jgi:hypothetical protein
VLIRLFDPDSGWRARVGRRMEEWGVRLRRDGSTFRPLPVRALAEPLEAAGFSVRVAPAGAGRRCPTCCSWRSVGRSSRPRARRNDREGRS